MKSIDVLLLSRADVVSLDLTPADVVKVVTQALQEHAAGTYEMHPKIGVHPIAAKHCAMDGAETLTLAGCGFEGSMHLWFLTQLLLTLRQVRLRDIRPEAMDRLAEQACGYFTGEIVVCADNESCLRDADVISTCTNGEQRLIEAGWFKPGGFAVGIEGGCAFTAEALHSADTFLVDDVALARYFDAIGRDRKTADGQPDPEFPGGMPHIDATIGEVVTGKKPGRQSQSERIITIPIGMAICDVALAHLAYHRALERGVGQRFALT